MTNGQITWTHIVKDERIIFAGETITKEMIKIYSPRMVILGIVTEEKLDVKLPNLLEIKKSKYYYYGYIVEVIRDNPLLSMEINETVVSQRNILLQLNLGEPRIVMVN